MQKHTVLRDVLAFGADDAVAIAAPSAKPMTFAALRQQIGETAQALSAFGAGSKTASPSCFRTAPRWRRLF